MRCPYCSQRETKVLDTRTTEEGLSIRRRRECSACRERFTTYERLEELPLIVIKKDHRREIFDRNKILRGLIRASEKRSISKRTLEKMVEGIEQRLQNQMVQEIKSRDLGEMVMEDLKKIDEVAYVRFASVYRHFKDIQSFKEELERLLEES